MEERIACPNNASEARFGQSQIGQELATIFGRHGNDFCLYGCRDHYRLRAFGRDPTGRARLKADLAAAEPAPA